MKTFLSILFVTFIINISFASKLQLSFAQYGNYTIEINGAIYKTQGNSINLVKLRGGNHHLRIIRKTRNGYNQQMIRQVIYNSSINLPARSTIQASISQPYQLQINNVIPHQSQVTTYTHQNNNSQNTQINYNHQNNYNNNNYNNQVNYNYTNNNTSFNHNHHHSCNDVNYKNGFSHKEFQRLLYRIDNQPNPRFKQQTIINAINRQGVYTHQLSILLNRFHSDIVKLDIAKAAYYHTIDPQNYEVINTSFYYQSSINEITCFVHQH